MMSPGGHRAGKLNEGVGEHVRGKSHVGERPPVKLRSKRSAPIEEGRQAMPGSSAGPFLRTERSLRRSELCRNLRSGRLT